MSNGVSARVAALFTLLLGVSIAHAERRPVVVIDLSGDKATEDLARALGPELQNHPDLQPVADPAIPGLLLGSFEDDDREALARAQAARVRAEEHLARYEFPVAESVAGQALRDLEQVMPGTAMLQLYAQLAFARGQAQLGVRDNTAPARESFALASRLDPSFVPDAARYLPDVVQAFDAAKIAWVGKGTLAVAGTGKLWLDGKDAGIAPAELEVAAGPHVVWLTGSERVTQAGTIIVTAGQKAELAIKDAPADERLKVRRARTALRYAPDPAARATAMKQLAALVGVRDAVLLTAANGKIIVQTWNAGTREQTPGFSALRELRREQPVDLLAPLAPPKPKVDIKPPSGPVEPKPDTRRWYERRTVQASIVVGGIAAVIAAVLVYRRLTDDTVLFDPDFGQAMAQVRF